MLRLHLLDEIPTKTYMYVLLSYDKYLVLQV